MKSWFSKKDRLLAGTIIAGASVLGFASPTYAQEVAAAEEEEAIVVTGSRIARANLTSPTAVTTVDAQAIELTGEDNIAEILRGVPSFGVSAVSSGNSNFFTTSNGINTLQLRNLGEDRTLVLVNGRRYVSGVPGSSAVDFNTIPTDLLERVEVITGGASAIYGADALAGVINLILRDDFEGVEYRYQYGESEHGDDVNHRFSMLAGGNFADGRGNAAINAAFTQNGGVFARDRDNTAVDDIALCAATGGPADPENCQTSLAPFFSSFSPFGRFFDYSTVENTLTCVSGTGPTCTVGDFALAAHGFNRQAHRRYTVPIERFMLSGLVNYEINPSLEAFAETMFTHTTATSETEPFPHTSYDLGGPGGIPCTNPFVPAAMVAALCDGGDTFIPYTRRMVEVGNRGAESNRSTYRVLLGLRGDFAERYNWETYYSYGRTEDNLRGGGQINTSNIRDALNVIDTGGVGDPADFICASAQAVAAGCVPLNLFGVGSITPEMAAWINAPTQRQSFNQQEFAGATISGPMFELPAGDAEFAFGVEWRRERSEDYPDALTQTGQNGGNIALPTVGSYSVGEIFAETEFPLIREQPFVHDLTLGLAFRVT
jgi:iron complex outermembrane recepter protein